MVRPKKHKHSGEAFKKLLKKKGFTAYKISQITGIGRHHLSKICTGVIGSPEPQTLEKIARAFSEKSGLPLEVELGCLAQLFANPPSSTVNRERISQAASLQPDQNCVEDGTPRKEPVEASQPAQPDSKVQRHRGLFIPNARCRTVWGRKALIEEILYRLSAPQELSVFSLSGGAGYGKTEAASQVSKAVLERNLFADVLWVTARQTELVDGRISQPNQLDALNWNQFLNQIAHQLACPIERVQQRLREEKFLVVLDNAETSQVENILASLVKMLHPSKALITSRLKTNPQFVKLITIQGIDKQSSHNLLRDEAEHKDIPTILQASNEQLDRIYELSCGAPLALHFIVGRVLDDQAIEPVLSALEQASGEVEQFYKFSLETAWQRISDIAKDVLRYIGQADASIPWLELSSVRGILESDWNQARRELKRWYLIEDRPDPQGNQRYDLHPWVRSTMRAGLVDNWEASLNDLEQILKWKFDI